MTARSVTIIDGGGANLASLQFALQRLGWTGRLTTDPAVIAGAERVILPGVGAARDAMDRLRAAELIDCIRELRQPLLGICLGLQLLFSRSEEDDVDCLDILPGIARRFTPSRDLTVPHMGWNQIRRTTQTPLLDGIPDGTYFYFVHSYAVDVTDCTLATTDYGREFCAVAGRDNFYATQFHPERSGRYGAQLLENFLTRIDS